MQDVSEFWYTVNFFSGPYHCVKQNGNNSIKDWLKQSQTKAS